MGCFIIPNLLYATAFLSANAKLLLCNIQGVAKNIPEDFFDSVFSAIVWHFKVK